LLAKAESTQWDAEAAALVEKAYQLLAGVINAAGNQPPPASAAPRRHERRLRRERRAGRRSGGVTAPLPGTDPTAAYGRLAHVLRAQDDPRIDLAG